MKKLERKLKSKQYKCRMIVNKGFLNVFPVSFFDFLTNNLFNNNSKSFFNSDVFSDFAILDFKDSLPTMNNDIFRRDEIWFV